MAKPWADAAISNRAFSGNTGAADAKGVPRVISTTAASTACGNTITAAWAAWLSQSRSSKSSRGERVSPFPLFSPLFLSAVFFRDFLFCFFPPRAPQLIATATASLTRAKNSVFWRINICADAFTLCNNTTAFRHASPRKGYRRVTRIVAPGDENEHSYLIDCAGFTPLNGPGTAMFVICIAVIRHGR